LSSVTAAVLPRRASVSGLGDLLRQCLQLARGAHLQGRVRGFTHLVDQQAGAAGRKKGEEQAEGT